MLSFGHINPNLFFTWQLKRKQRHRQIQSACSLRCIPQVLLLPKRNFVFRIQNHEEGIVGGVFARKQQQQVSTFKEIWELSEDVVNLLPVEKSDCIKYTDNAKQQHNSSDGGACNSTGHILVVFFLPVLRMHLLRLPQATSNCIRGCSRKLYIPAINRGILTLLLLFYFSFSLLHKKLSSIALPAAIFFRSLRLIHLMQLLSLVILERRATSSHRINS